MKPRKMLGDINSEACRALMGLIGTQSHETLTEWAVGYARARYLPIAEKYCLDAGVLADSLDCALTCVERARESGKPTSKAVDAEAKAKLNAARDFARDESTSPIGQAAARAIATAGSVVRTPSNALGFLFYGAAAVAYDTLGLDAACDALDGSAQSELEYALASLEDIAVTDEPNSVKIDWNC